MWAAGPSVLEAREPRRPPEKEPLAPRSLGGLSQALQTPSCPDHPPKGCQAATSTVFPPSRAISAGWGQGGQASPCGQFCTLSRGLTRGKALRGLPSRSQGLCQLPETDVESEGEKKRQRASILNLME